MSKVNYCKIKEDSKMKFRPYRSLVVSLLYISSGKRLNIAFSEGQLSQHSDQPREEHWKVPLRVLRSLNLKSDHSEQLESMRV